MVATTSQPMSEPVFSSSVQYGSVLENDSGSSTSLTDRHKIAQVLVYYEGTEIGHVDCDGGISSYLVDTPDNTFLFHFFFFMKCICCACLFTSFQSGFIVGKYFQLSDLF